MKTGYERHSPEKFTAFMRSCNVRSDLIETINRCVEFHTSPAPGLLIGAFMADYALELLGAKKGDKLYGVCETPKCAPDALQIIAQSTIGNNRLKIVPIGKFAMTVNAATTGSSAEAVRVYIDLEKLKKFKTIDLWYANSPAYDKKTMDETLQAEIFRAGRDILSYERVRVTVFPKKKWKSVTCPGCGESIPDYLMEGERCGACGSMKYYEKIEG
jgi:formylmethanofuran dehydrogenase subunit E